MPFILDIGAGAVPVGAGGARPPTYLDSIMRGFGTGLDIQARAQSRSDQLALQAQHQANVDRQFAEMANERAIDNARTQQQYDIANRRADDQFGFAQEQFRYQVGRDTARDAEDIDNNAAFADALRFYRPNFETGGFDPNVTAGPPAVNPASPELPPEVARRLTPTQHIALLRMMSDDQREILAQKQQQRIAEQHMQAQQQQLAAAQLATQTAQNLGVVGPQVGPAATGQIEYGTFASLPQEIQQNLIGSAQQSTKIATALRAIETSDLPPEQRAEAMLRVYAVASGMPANVIPEGNKPAEPKQATFTPKELAGGMIADVDRALTTQARKNVRGQGVRGSGNFWETWNPLDLFSGDSAKFNDAIQAEKGRLRETSGLSRFYDPSAQPSIPAPAGAPRTGFANTAPGSVPVPKAAEERVRELTREAIQAGHRTPEAIKQYILQRSQGGAR